MTNNDDAQLTVDKALQQAHESLSTVAHLMTTTNSERMARVIGGQLDAALLAVETLLELRTGDQARTAGRFGVNGPQPWAPNGLQPWLDEPPL
ncbi:hypothetical protein [Nocardia sp. CNY236]|uniref:hypothetical protein n=1 Tax=Nocardia sp. CNY236 TaxID=1169152 RepID=UPI000426BFCA|nr:hypothetical protein [Nocardia sp. CNY236]